MNNLVLLCFRPNLRKGSLEMTLQTIEMMQQKEKPTVIVQETDVNSSAPIIN